MEYNKASNCRHEKRCEPANLVRGQFWQQMWTFWIKTTSHKDVEKNYSQIKKNIEKYPIQSQGTTNVSTKCQ